LINEGKVTEGRKARDIYERLKEDIERGRQMYHDRVLSPPEKPPPEIRDVVRVPVDEEGTTHASWTRPPSPPFATSPRTSSWAPATASSA
jgi:hypothetical protein